MTKNNHEGANGSWDKINSTYWWKINLLPNQKQSFFKGFSKKYGQNEAKDKDYLLCRIAMMLDEHGYLDKSTDIVIHKRTGLRCQEKDPIILTLLPNSFKLGDDILTDREIYRHIKTIYERRANPQLEQKEYFGPKPKTVNPGLDKEVQIAIDAKYHSVDQVLEAIRLLEAKGVAKGQYLDAYKKIMDKKENRNLK